MRRLFIVLAVSLGLSGCFGGGLTPVAPETPRESLVVAEAAYEFALLEVRSLIVSGVIIPKSGIANSISFVIKEARSALDAWQTNPDNPNLAVVAQAALRELQAEVARYVVTQESFYKADPVGGIAPFSTSFVIGRPVV